MTNPPVNSRHSARRPRSKRYRRRSLYAAAEDSPILCWNCGGKKHNRRTCSCGPGERISNSLLQAEEGINEHAEGKDEHEEGKDEDEEGWDEDEEGNDDTAEEESNDDKAEEESNDEDEETSDDEDDDTSKEVTKLLNNYTYKRAKKMFEVPRT